jgi:hypothetical protein
MIRWPSANLAPRIGAGRVLNRLVAAESVILLPRLERSRAWLSVALVECARCHQVVARTSPIQRFCPGCRCALKRARSREALRRGRSGP